MLDKKIIYSLIDNKVNSFEYNLNRLTEKELKLLLSALKVNKSLNTLNFYTEIRYNYEHIHLLILTIDYNLKVLSYVENNNVYINKNSLISLLKSKFNIYNLELTLNNNVKDDLITFLKNNNSILNLNLNVNNKSDNLFEIFKYNNKIHSLVLSSNKVLDCSETNKKIISNNDININKLAESLIDNKTLNSLYINSFNINDIDKLLEVLKSNNTLKILNISNNNINNIDKFVELLKENKTLQSIYLDNNKISNIDKLLEALKVNNTLKVLNLSNNNISKIDLNKLIELFTFNNSLNFLDITNNHIEDKNELYKLKVLKPKLRLYF